MFHLTPDRNTCQRNYSSIMFSHFLAIYIYIVMSTFVQYSYTLATKFGLVHHGSGFPQSSATAAKQSMFMVHTVK